MASTFPSQQGEIFGLLGPNGAGKTTTISIATTRALPTSGQVTIAGVDVVARPAAARRNIGVVPQYNTLDRSLTVFENLYFHCRYFGYSSAASRTRAQELLSQFLLQERGASFPAQLSGGMQQRVQIARAIAHRPAVLFLDEPSAGLDPQSRIAMWDAVKGLGSEGITVVLTTHYMEEADEICDRVAIMDHGKLLAQDTPELLKATLGAQTIFELKLRQMEGSADLVKNWNGCPMSPLSKPSAMVSACSLEGRMACCPRSCKRPRAWVCATSRSMSPAWKQCSSASPGEICVSKQRAGYAGAFLGLMLRDLRVLRRELGAVCRSHHHATAAVSFCLYLRFSSYGARQSHGCRRREFCHHPAARLDGRRYHVQRDCRGGASPVAGVRDNARD